MIQEFPKMIYSTNSPVIVETIEEQEALIGDWFFDPTLENPIHPLEFTPEEEEEETETETPELDLNEHEHEDHSTELDSPSHDVGGGSGTGRKSNRKRGKRLPVVAERDAGELGE